MKKNTIIIAIVIAGIGGIAIGGILFVKSLFAPAKPVPTEPEPTPEVILPTVAPSVTVDLVRSKVKENAVNLELTNLNTAFVSIEYELTYDSNGLIKGATSGSKPVDVSGQNAFTREIYLGSCSKNVCRPDPGVKAVSLVVTFTGTDGKRSQFSKDFPL